MSPKATETIARKWFDAFNTQNLEQLLALYSEDARHFSPKLKLRSPETTGLIIGKAALRNWWADCFERLPTLKYQPTSFIADDKAVFMEYIRKVAGEDDLSVGEVLEIQDGLIVGSRVYHG